MAKKKGAVPPQFKRFVKGKKGSKKEQKIKLYKARGARIIAP